MRSFDTRYYYPNDVDIVSIVSSNMTEDDRPGPGRILGNVYSSLGRQLESLLNSFAERRGLGPEAVAHRVRRREEDLFNRRRLERPPTNYTKEEAVQQRKDVKKLVRYAKCADKRLSFIWRSL